MSEKAELIRQGLQHLGKKVGPVQTMLAQVESIDEDAATCVLDEDGLLVNDVRLRPVLNGKESITIYPKPGCWVLAVRIEDDEDWMVVAADEVDKYRLKVGDTELEVKDGFLVKRGEDTLKEVLQLIIEAVSVVVVLQGTNPDYTKLQEALTKAQNLLK